jgi:hypothetical protein
LIRCIFLLFSAALAAQTPARHASLDPAFEKYPFEQWLGEGDAGHIHWTAKIDHAELSFHQRLEAQVEVTLDGRDLDSRRADGNLVLLVQIADQSGTRFQDHGNLELGRLDDNVRATNLQYTWRAFVLPGEYRLAVAIVDTATGDHGTRQTTFRVGPAPRELPADTWRDLPAVEFVGKAEPPDGWFLPGVHGKLQWAAAAHSPAHLNVILNVAPSVPTPGARRTPSGDLSALLPTVKALSETGSPAVSDRVELLDLARRRAVFDQKQVRELDWPRLKDSLGESSTASIDIHSLSERHHDAQFFVSQVRSMLRASEQPCALVVLSSPVAFESGEDLEPISLEALPSCHVFYIRYRPPTQRIAPLGGPMGGRRGGRMGGPMGRNRVPLPAIDQLESTLKPLKPKVFESRGRNK